MMPPLGRLALGIVPAIVAITLHEAAHGYAALALGDDTARRAGRLSLNPLRHVDRVGTIILPGLLLLSQLVTIGHVAFMFGWAKPVPVDASRLRSPRRGMALVAAAGPAMNATLAWIGALLLHVVALLPPHMVPAAAILLGTFILTNVVLGLFNLLPIPPLDGGRIAVGLLPIRWARGWARLERGGLAIIVLGLFLMPALLRGVGLRFDPLGDLLGEVVRVVVTIIMRLAGHG